MNRTRQPATRLPTAQLALFAIVSTVCSLAFANDEYSAAKTAFNFAYYNCDAIVFHIEVGTDIDDVQSLEDALRRAVQHAKDATLRFFYEQTGDPQTKGSVLSRGFLTSDVPIDELPAKAKEVADQFVWINSRPARLRWSYCESAR